MLGALNCLRHGRAESAFALNLCFGFKLGLCCYLSPLEPVKKAAGGQAALRARSKTVRNEMRGPQALNNKLSKVLTEGCVRCSQEERGSTSFSVDIVGQRVLMRQNAYGPREKRSGYESTRDRRRLEQRTPSGRLMAFAIARKK